MSAFCFESPRPRHKWFLFTFEILSIFCCVFSYGVVSAATEDSKLPIAGVGAGPEAIPVRVPEWQEMFTDLPKDLSIFGKQVLRKEGLLVTAGVVAMTGVLVATDYESWQAARMSEVENPVVSKWANQGVSMGDGFFQFGIVGGLLAFGGATHKPRFVRAAAQVTESIFATGIVVQVIKHVTGRESPFSSESRTGIWRIFPDQIEYHKDFQKYDAVPSGHLSTAITTFIVIQENFPEQKWIPYVGWPAMGLIAYGLAATSIHWWSDFPIAVALGYGFAQIITQENRTDPSNINKKGLVADDARSWRQPKLYPGITSSGAPLVMLGWAF